MKKKDPRYPKHSIREHIMPFNLVFGLNDTTERAIKRIQNEPILWPNIKHLFIVDNNNKLIGTVELTKILASTPDTKLQDLVNKKSPFVTERSHQSNVAKIALKTGVETIPVVDEENHFVGIINTPQILKILHEEHVEELMKFSGIQTSEVFLDMAKARFTQVVKTRLPWLILGLMGGILATLVVEQFELALKKEIALAFFIPVIVYMNDAVGTQTETIFVRFTSLEKVSLKTYLFNELKIAILIALTLSSLILIFTLAWFQSINIALIVGSSMFIGIVTSVIIATFIPWILLKFEKDPAVGAGPFTTIIQDLFSILIYFSIASVIL